MTVGTNALLEGKGARTRLVATEGFGDVLELRRQTRAHLYRLDVHHPPPARAPRARPRGGGAVRPRGRAACRSTRRRSSGWSRRCGPTAPRRWPRAAVLVRPPGARGGRWPRRCGGAARRARERVERGPARDPRVRAHLDDRRGRVPDAAAAPYLGRLAERASATRACPPRRSCSRAAACCRSPTRGRARRLDRPERPRRRRDRRGPAGGRAGRAAGPDLRHGRHLVRRRPGRATATPAAHQRARSSPATPCTCRCSTWRRSRPAAAASPGPTPAARCAWARTRRARAPARRPTASAATEPTVTDANVVLGRLPADAPLGGAHPPGRRDAAGAAVGGLADEPRPGRWRSAREGIVTVAVQEMVRALRLVSVERGEDPREADAHRVRRRRAAARLPGGRRARACAAWWRRRPPACWRPWAWWWRASGATTCRRCSRPWTAARRPGPPPRPAGATRPRTRAPGRRCTARRRTAATRARATP